MIYCFDLDETLCYATSESYADAVPFERRINKVNKLFDEHCYIKIYTARGMISGTDYRELTEWQLEEWGIRHHELIMGKPAADIYIDDKAKSDKEFFNEQ